MTTRRRFARRASHEAGRISNDRWLLTYADMITLLMVFFAVLFAISNTDLRKFAALTQSLQRAFNVDVLAGYQAFTVSNGIDTRPETQRLDLGVGAITSAAFQSLRAQILDAANLAGQGGDVSVTANKEGITIRISGSLLFSSGRATLDAKSESLLATIIESIKPLPNNIRVEGHTDDVAPPANSFFADNWQLSTARALTVAERLMASGLNPARLSAAGYASYKPLVPNDSEQNRRRNRRVDIVVLFPTVDGGAGSAGASSGLVAPPSAATFIAPLETTAP